jgi:hypothetical protein
LRGLDWAEANAGNATTQTSAHLTPALKVIGQRRFI